MLRCSACALLFSCCCDPCLSAAVRLANLPEVAGCEAKLRMEGDKPYVTDNSNYIVDLYFQVCAAYTPNKSRCIWGLADCGLVMCSRGHGISA